MKNLLKYICIGALVVISLVSCGKKPINGKLDGRWQLMSIHYREDGKVENPEFTYYDINLHLLKLWKTKGLDGSFGDWIFARFNHDGDSLHVRMIGMTAAVVKPFGMNDTIQHFGVEKLTKKEMILNSNYARLEFRKF